MIKRIAALCLSASCIIGFISNSPASAENDSDDLGKKQAADQRLESQIIAAETAARDLEQCCHHLHRTASDLINEAQRQTLEVVASADEVGPIIMPIEGVVPAGDFLPCRKKFLDLFMNQLHDVVPMVKKDADGIKLDKDAGSSTAFDALASIDSLSDKLEDQLEKLEQYTKGPTYDNVSIAREAKALQAQVSSLSASCRVLTKELKQEDRTVTKELRQLEKQIRNQGSHDQSTDSADKSKSDH